MGKIIALIRGGADQRRLATAWSDDELPEICTGLVIDVVDDALPTRMGSVHRAIGVVQIWLEDPLPARNTIEQLMLPLAGAEWDAYVVRERVQRRNSRRTAIGASPGMAAVFEVQRSPSMSFEEFDSYWRDRHAPLAMRHHQGAATYVQHLVEGRFGSGSTPAWHPDGIAELSFPTEADLVERMFVPPESEALIGADLAKFVGVVAGGPMREFVVRPPADETVLVTG